MQTGPIIDPNTIIENANPFSVAVYGIMVLFLILAIILLWRDNKSKDRYNQERDKLVLEFQNKAMQVIGETKNQAHHLEAQHQTIINLITQHLKGNG